MIDSYIAVKISKTIPGKKTKKSSNPFQKGKKKTKTVYTGNWIELSELTVHSFIWHLDLGFNRWSEERNWVDGIPLEFYSPHSQPQLLYSPSGVEREENGREILKNKIK